MFENIDRIKAPPRDVFLRDYVLAQRPVILTDLFARQAISEIRSEADARAALGEMTVLVQEGYEHYYASVIRSLLQGSMELDMRQEEMSLSAYLDRVIADPKSRLICSEVPQGLIAPLGERFRIPDYCKTADGEPDPLYAYEVWMANKGNFTHLHYDGDQRQALQYQLFGRKRAVLVPPTSSKKLGPISNTVVFSPEGVPDAEMDAFVRSVNGYQCMLQAGDTLFMPALIWHGFEYVDTSMALTLRFHRNAANAFLAEQCHRDASFQALGWHLVDADGRGARWKELLGKLQAAHRTGGSSGGEKAEALQRLVEEEHERLCTECLAGTYTRGFYDVLRASVRSLEVMAGGLYEEDAAAQAPSQ